MQTCKVGGIFNVNILVCSKYIVLLWQHWCLHGMPLKLIWLWIWIWGSMACGSRGRLYLTSLHSNRGERGRPALTFQLSQSLSLFLPLSRSPVMCFYSLPFVVKISIHSVARYHAVERVCGLQTMDGERQREIESCGGQEANVFFFLSLLLKSHAVKGESETYLPI